ncbi:MAG: hypothetical protein ABIE74_00245 [Pseudomonadota bacterium]
MQYLAILILCLTVLISCGGNSSDVESSTDPSVVTENSELETLTYWTDPNTGDTVLGVQPNINSKGELLAYREQKIEEAEQILALTRNKSVEKPYYPVVITMNKPISLAEVRQMLGRYNPSVAKVLKSVGSINYLPKAELVKNEDALIIGSVKFVSTEGGGQLSYDTLTREKEMSKLEKQIAFKEKELNGVENYRVVKGITSVTGGIHRDSIMSIQEDANVFLADIGPIDMYKTKPETVLWNDIYRDVEKYSK